MLKKAVSSGQSFDEIHIYLGETYLLSKNEKEGCEHLLKAVELNESGAQSLYQQYCQK
jgi:hypothetical protein